MADESADEKTLKSELSSKGIKWWKFEIAEVVA
jgi:hypothetical protein